MQVIVTVSGFVVECGLELSILIDVYEGVKECYGNKRFLMFKFGRLHAILYIFHF